MCGVKRESWVDCRVKICHILYGDGCVRALETSSLSCTELPLYIIARATKE